MANVKLRDWRIAKWAQNAVYSAVGSAKILTGYAPNVVIPSGEHNELFNQASVAISELQTAGTLLYNDQLAMQKGAIFAVVESGEVKIRQCMADQSAGFNPDPAQNSNIKPFPNPLNATEVSAQTQVDTNIFPPVNGANVQAQIQQLVQRTAFLRNSSGLNIPIGTLSFTAAETAEPGWLALTSSTQLVSITQYPEAFAKLGTRFGGNGTTNFGLPTIQEGRALLFNGSSASGSVTSGEVKSHTHSVLPSGVSGINAVGGGSGLTGGGTSPSAISLASYGGTDNLAAGVKFLLCIKMYDVLSSNHYQPTEANNYIWPEKVESLGDVAGDVVLDFSAGTVFEMTVTGDVIFTAENLPVPGLTYEFGLRIVNGGAHSITWPEGWSVEGSLSVDGISIVQGYVQTSSCTAWVMYAASSSSVAALIADLANTTDPAKGAWMLGATPGRTQRDKNTEIRSILDFSHLVADGDWTDALRAALVATPDGGTLRIPKRGIVGTGPSYLLTEQVIVSNNDISIVGDGITEYSDGFMATFPGHIIKVTGYGVRFENIVFQGNGSTTVLGDTSGILFDRRSLGDDATYANIDANIISCSFFLLGNGVTAYGRNVFIFDNIFSYTKSGIRGELHTYTGGTSEFRGWRINRNRFHGVGGAYIDTDSSVPLPANFFEQDAWCIQMPQTSDKTSHLEIKQNNADFCGAGFYKGYLAGASICDNITHGGTSCFVFAKIDDADNAAASTGYQQRITGNTINSANIYPTTQRGAFLSENTIYVKGVMNLTISNNEMRGALYQHIYAQECSRLKLRDNDLLNANQAYQSDSTKRPALTVIDSDKVNLSGTFIDSQLGAVYNDVVTMVGCANVRVGSDNSVNGVAAGDVAYNIPPSSLRNSSDDGLAWVTPSLENGFLPQSDSMLGFRKLFNGMVEIDVALTGGTDNTVAFYLPEGMCPAENIYLPAIAIWTDGSDAYAQIAPSGAVYINWNTSPANNYHIRHTFPAA